MSDQILPAGEGIEESIEESVNHHGNSRELSLAHLIVGCLVFEEVILLPRARDFDYNNRVENATRIIAALLKDRLLPDQPGTPFEW